MNQRFAEFNHQGVVASAGTFTLTIAKLICPLCLRHLSQKPCLLLILDGVTDPHNLGACLRVADATGVDFVVIPKDKNASYYSCSQQSCLWSSRIHSFSRVTNLVRAMELIKQEGVWIYGAAGEAKESLYEIDLQSLRALVMGAEGEGMRRLTREHCDGLFALPMLGSVESLNVSVATGVSLYEVVRQRR